MALGIKIILLITLTWGSQGFRAQKSRLEQRTGLKGKVKSVKEFKKVTLSAESNPKGSHEVFTWTRFNPQGNILEHKSFKNRDGSGVFSHCVSTYDTKENLIENQWFQADGSQKSKQTYTYKKHGYRWFMSESKQYQGSGALISMQKYIYANHFNNWYIKEEIQHNANGLKVSSATYDSHGNEIEVIYYNLDGSVKSKHISKRDNKGRPTQWMQAQKDKPLKSERTTSPLPQDRKQYNKLGQLLTLESYNPKGALQYKINFQYDSLGKQIESKLQETNGTHTKHIFSYDAKGNWIQKIEHKNGTPQWMVEREIQYYR